MGIRNAKPITVRPEGLTDSLDGSNSFPGSMTLLRNLIPAYHTPNVFTPRPAAVTAISLSSINPNGVVNAMLVVGSRVYGMIESTTYAGKDEPFCYDLATSAFVSLTGVASALLPSSPSRIGDWTPPTMTAVTNSLILVTHPGFPGGAGPYLGWIDISGLSNTIIGNTTSGSPVIQSVVTTQGVSAPILQGVQPGQLVTGPGIPAGTYVKSCANGTFSLNTTGNTHGSTTLDGLANVTGVVPGMMVTGAGIPAGTYVSGISGTTVTLSQAAAGSITGTAINFSGGGTITLSANATATANVQTFTVAAGTYAAPLWGAGNLNTNPLSTVPSCAAGFNGRAYIGVSNYLVYSDPLKPLQVSQASQALVIGDNASITALAGVPLTSQLTGGVQQSLTVFKGAGALTQITGDAATSDLKQNTVVGSVGTLAPLSIASTPEGTAFMAVDGLRVLGLTGVVSEPIGTGGTGVAIPFLNALYPSRMCADYAENVYRITVQNTADSRQPFYEYWFDFKTKGWTGPHTSASRLVVSYPTGASFLIVPRAVNAVVQQSDVLPRATSSFVENGVRLAWNFKTSPLPDNAEASFNKVVQTSLSCSLHTSDVVQATFTDETGVQIAYAPVRGFLLPKRAWGATGMKWGAGVWGGAGPLMREVPIKWPKPVVFRQGALSISGPSSFGQLLGNVYAKFQSVRLNVPIS